MSKSKQIETQNEILEMLSKVNGGDKPESEDTGNGKPGFLVVPIPSIAANPEFRFCECDFSSSCPNLTCFIQKNVNERENTVADLKEFSLLIVPIRKLEAKKPKDTVTVPDNKEEPLQSSTQKGNPEEALHENREKPHETVAENKATQTPMESEDDSFKSLNDQEVHSVCEDMDASIREKLTEITKIKEPTTGEELLKLLRASESEDFRAMLEQKVAEIANGDDGDAKVAVLEDYYMKKGMLFWPK